MTDEEPGLAPTEQQQARTTGRAFPHASPNNANLSLGASFTNAAERFLLGSEIARGGMGIVYRARDLSLDREVAIKFVQPWVMDQPNLVARFLDEARITAQLPHPGIPPVYEIRSTDDGRPMLAMKLIEGRTLHELLKERATCRDDLPRWLNVLEQICLAVGYAHSRGVIHRDLKPQNIMVGEFGEVQVMDWGLAKVVGTSEPDTKLAPTVIKPRAIVEIDATQLGDMVGTPAFMPPEQANGLVDLVDHRADVFGLGAILCVILTGRAPSTGNNREETLAMARQGAIEPAKQRLIDSEAEPELLSIALRCLTPDVEDRPRDAGTVAAAMAQLRETSQQRAQQAEVERARAQVQVAEARKRQQVQLALAIAVLALFAVLGVGAWWRQSEVIRRTSEQQLRDQEDRQRLDRNRASAELAWGRADELRRRELWDESIIALKQAEELLADDPDPQLRDRVKSLKSELELLRSCDEIDTRFHSQLVAQSVRRVESKLTTLSTLNNLAKAAGSGNQLNAELTAAFKAYGWDLYGGDHQTTVAQIKAAKCFPQFIVVLDKMALFDPHPLRRAQLLGFIDLLTGESWRTEFAVSWFLPNRLQALVRKIPLEKRSPALYNSVASRLGTINRPAAISILRSAINQYPDNNMLMAQLGMSLAMADPPQTNEAIGVFRGCLALNPNHPNSWMMLGKLELDRDGHREAQDAYLRLVELRPDISLFWYHLGLAYYFQKDYISAIEPLRMAVKIEPQNYLNHYMLGLVLDYAQDPVGAAEALNDAIRLAPTQLVPRQELADLYEFEGKFDLAAQNFRDAMAIAPQDKQLRFRLIGVLSKLGNQKEREEQLLDLYELDPKDLKTIELLAESHALRGEGKRAIELYEQLVQGPEDQLEERQRRLIQLYRQFSPQAVPEAVRAATGRKLKHSRFWYELANELRQSQQASAAVIAMRHAMSLSTPEGFAHVNLVFMLLESGDVAAANDYARQQLHADPQQAWAHSCLAAVLSWQGKLDDAAIEYQTAIRLAPDFHSAYNDYGILLRQQGKSADAVAIYRQLLNASPQYQFAWGNYGRALRDVGELAASRDAFQKALSLGKLSWIEQELMTANRWLDFETKLPRWRSGDLPLPSTLDDALPVIDFCVAPYQRDHYTAYRIYLAGVANDPRWEHSYRWAAIKNVWPALDEAREDKKPTDQERLQLSEQCRAWLEAELAAIKSELSSTDDVVRRAAEEKRALLSNSSVFHSLRQPSELKLLPPEEIAKWEAVVRDLP